MTPARRTVAVAAAAAALVAAVMASLPGQRGTSPDSAPSAGRTPSFASQDSYDILTQSIAAMRALHSVRMTSTGNFDGLQGTAEILLDTSGRCRLDMTASEIGHVEMVLVDERSFIRADRRFWRLVAGAGVDLARFTGRWVRVYPPGDQDLRDMCDLDRLLARLNTPGRFDATTKVPDVAAGEPAIELISATGAGVARVWVATEGEHYLLKTSISGAEAETVTFADFDVPVDIEAPAEGEYVDPGAESA